MTLRRKARRNWERDILVTRMVLDGATLGQVGLKMDRTRERIRTMVQRTIEAAHELSGHSTDPRWTYIDPASLRYEAAFFKRWIDKLEARYVVIDDTFHVEQQDEVSHG